MKRRKQRKTDFLHALHHAFSVVEEEGFADGLKMTDGVGLRCCCDLSDCRCGSINDGSDLANQGNGGENIGRSASSRVGAELVLPLRNAVLARRTCVWLHKSAPNGRRNLATVIFFTS